MPFYKSGYCLLVIAFLLCSCRDKKEEVIIAPKPTLGKCLVTAIKFPKPSNFSSDSVAFKYTTDNKLIDIEYYYQVNPIPKLRSKFRYNTDGGLSKIEIYNNFNVDGSEAGGPAYSFTMTLNEKKQVVKTIMYGQPEEPRARRYITQRSFEYDSKGRLFKIDTDSSSAGAFEGGYLYRRFEYDNSNNVTKVYRKVAVVGAYTMVELIEKYKSQPELLMVKHEKFDDKASPFRLIKETIDIHDLLTINTTDLSENNVLTASYLSFNEKYFIVEDRVYNYIEQGYPISFALQDAPEVAGKIYYACD